MLRLDPNLTMRVTTYALVPMCLSLLSACAFEVDASNFDEDELGADLSFRTVDQHSAATPDEAKRWPNGVVPFEIDSTFSSADATRFRSIMAEWRTLTNGAIRFEERNGEDDFILVNEESDSSKRCRTGGKRGNVGGRFDLWLKDSGECSNRTVFHELGHVLGLEHEQKRADRDFYVVVTMSGVLANDWTEGDFSKVDSTWNVGAFDLGSIMLYNPSAGAIDSVPRPSCCPTGTCGSPGDSCFYPGPMVVKTDTTRPTARDIQSVQTIYGVPANWHLDTSWCRRGNHFHSLDVDGNGRDDLLCHSVVGSAIGRRQVDRSNSSGHFLGIEFDSNSHPDADKEWCFGTNYSLYTGDFDGDGQEDLLCHNTESGQRRVDLANNNNEYLGSNWSSTSDPNSGDAWCSGNNTLHVGKFDNNNRDDILCLGSTGRRRIDYSNSVGEFQGTDWDSDLDPSADSDWCFGSGNNLHVGDFDADGQDDLLCHNISSGAGNRSVDYASNEGRFHGTNWDSNTDSGAYNFCSGGSRKLFVADISNDGRADILCFNPEIGSISRRLTDQDGEPKGASWAGEIGFCKAEDGELHMGDYNGDHRVDALCHNVETGHKAIRFANSSSQL